MHTYLVQPHWSEPSAECCVADVVLTVCFSTSAAENGWMYTGINLNYTSPFRIEIVATLGEGETIIGIDDILFKECGKCK